MTSTSADADAGPRDPCPIDYIALHSELDTRQQALVDTESNLPQRPRLLAYMCNCMMVMLKLHWFGLLLTYCTSKFATNPQQNKLMELESKCISSLVSTIRGARNIGPLLTALLTSQGRSAYRC